MDMTIVAFAIRTGYLFDAFAIRDKRKTLKEVLTDCLKSLRKDIPRFNGVTLLHDPTSDQLFYVNAKLLQQHPLGRADLAAPLVADAGDLPAVTFVQLDSSVTKICPPPSQLLSLFAHLELALLGEKLLPEVVSLPEDKRTQDIGTMVAFAACLLEFPVAYVPASGGSGPFLAGVPLDVYECVLELDDDPRPTGLPEKHVMLKFSCPCIVAETTPELRPEMVVGRLKARFGVRLEQSGFPGRMIVRHSIETLDRVAM
ncbi:hypothetical protein BV20DRAFT_972822 [Pilatotrama ljubarskyi]|nr:hypothetical protein BV20DRAFT_972822 [Pilatotrama ljubarskyi]